MKKTPKKYSRSAVFCLLLSAFCAAASGFRIREHEGCVAVWDCADSAWVYVSDVPVSALPESDRTELTNGIFVPSSAELPAILEDFCS